MMLERPGAVELKRDVDDLNERIEELKKLVALKEKLVSEKLKKAEEYRKLGEDLKDWLEEKKKEADSTLPVDDLSSEELKKKADKAKELKKELEEHLKDKDRLNQLFKELTSCSPEDLPENKKEDEPCTEVNKLWDDLSNRLDEDEPTLQDLSGVADSHESDYQALSDWLGPTKDKAAALATVPSDLSAVQDNLKAIESLEQELGEKQPQFESCCDSGATLASACEDPATADLMNKKVDALQEDWKDLLDSLNAAKEKLQRAAEGGEKLEGLVGETLDWMDGLNGRISGLGPVGVRSPIIQDQTKEHQALASELQAGKGNVDKAQEVGEDMLKDLEGAEKAKLEEKLAGLAGRMSELEGKLEQHKEKLEDAASKAQDFEDKEKSLDEWLSEKEAVLKDWEALPVDSIGDKIGEFDQEVANHYPAVAGLMEAEGKLLGAEPENIVPFEKSSSEDKPEVATSAAAEMKKKKKKKDKKDKEEKKEKQDDLPEFMQRPGSQEVIDEAGELRNRYEQLKKDASGKLEEVEDLLAKTLGELTGLTAFSEDSLSDLLSRAPLADSLEGVKKQQKDHQELAEVVLGKKPEVMKYAKLSVKCRSPELLDTIKKQHAALGKQWGQLLQNQQKWGKLVNGCVEAWQAAQEAEEALEELEKWMVGWGPTADNQTILLQQAQLEAFSKDQVDPFKERFAAVNTAAEKLASLGGHPPVSSLVARLQERFDCLNSSLEARMAGAAPACDTAQSFDQKQAPLTEWLGGASSEVKSLFPVELDAEKLSKTKQTLEGIQKDARSREDEVTAVVALATTFEEQREPLVKEDYRYCGKLESLTPPPFDVSVVKGNRAPPTEESSSIQDQSDALKSQWEWILKQSIEQLDTVNDLLARVQEFEAKKKALSDFIEEGKSKLDKEKPIGSDSARIKEQLDTCKSYRSELGDKQAEVEGTLALGRSLLTSPHTSADSHDFEEDLKEAIREWSDLQLGWENWYRELQSASDKSSAVEQSLEDLKAWLNQARDRTGDLFPVKPESASVRSDLEDAKGSFTQDVLSPCEKQKEALKELKANLPLLKDPEEAQKIFDEFEEFAKDAEDKAHKLDDALQWAERYDQEKSPVEQALEAIERKLAESKSVPSDNEGLTDLKDNLDSMKKDMQEKAPAVEQLLKDLEEADSLKDIMVPDLFEKERDNMKKRWDRANDEVAGRSADVDAAQEKNKEYQDLKDPFAKWLGAAEGDKKKLKKVPKGRRKMKKYSDDIDSFKADVDEHKPDSEAVEEKGKEFVDAAKAHDSRLEDYKDFLSEENPAALQPTLTGSTPKRSIKDDSGAAEVEQEVEDLRRRYDNLKLQTDNRKEAFDGAKVKRDPVDELLSGLLPQLEALEAKCTPLTSTERSPGEPEEIKEEVTLAEECQLECSNLESGLQALDEGANQWFSARDGDKPTSSDRVDGDLEGAEDSQSEDEDDVDQEKQDLSDRLKKMKDFLAGKKDDLDSKLSSADKLRSDLDQVEKWLEPKEKQRPDMKPGAVRSKPLEEQFVEAEGFAKELSDFQPEIDSLAASLPPLPALNGAVANGDANSHSTPAEPPTVTKCRDCLQRFEDLKTDAANRLEMLEELKPKVDKVESDLAEVDGQVKDWEAWAEDIKAMDTAKIDLLRKQAKDIESLKAQIAALEEAKWCPAQSDCDRLLNYNVGPFGKVVSPQPPAAEANGDHKPASSPAAGKKKKSKSKKKGAQGKGVAAANGGQV